MAETHDDVHKLAEALLPEPKRHEQFLRHLDEAKAKARVSVDVPADEYEQAGRKILVASCPICTHVTALDGEGKHQCRSCHTWLRYVRKQ